MALFLIMINHYRFHRHLLFLSKSGDGFSKERRINDLIEVYENIEADNLAFVRVEQLYPFPEDKLSQIVKKYGESSRYIWAQEEPENMGAWSFIIRKWNLTPINCHSRLESGSPASGSPKVHENRHSAIIDQVMSYTKKK